MFVYGSKKILKREFRVNEDYKRKKNKKIMKRSNIKYSYHHSYVKIYKVEVQYLNIFQ